MTKTAEKQQPAFISGNNCLSTIFLIPFAKGDFFMCSYEFLLNLPVHLTAKHDNQTDYIEKIMEVRKLTYIQAAIFYAAEASISILLIEI
jgi:hypothetical protein